MYTKKHYNLTWFNFIKLKGDLGFALITRAFNKSTFTFLKTGGFPMLYLGYYTYISGISKDNDRATRLARMDGIEQIAVMIGTFLSPKIFKALSYHGSYGFSLGIRTVAFLYTVFCVR